LQVNTPNKKYTYNHEHGEVPRREGVVQVAVFELLSSTTTHILVHVQWIGEIRLGTKGLLKSGWHSARKLGLGRDTVLLATSTAVVMALLEQ